MNVFPQMVTWEEAIELIKKNILPITEEFPISINDAYGRVSSRDIYSPIDLPTFPMSLVDGFAVGDFSGKWKIIGEVKIGYSHDLEIDEGECVRVPTGGIVPKGAVAVLKIEDVKLTDSDTQGDVIYEGEIIDGQEIVPAGNDVQKGTLIVSKGQKIGFKEITFLSAVGIPTIYAFRKPRIFVIITGHEIKPPGTDLNYGETYDSTSTMLRSFISALGGEVLEVIYVGEDSSSIRGALGQCIPIADLIITTGGTSVGKSDNVAKTVKSLGDIIFHGMNVRPGKPMLFGMIDNTPILGFPGFVTSSLVMANLLLPIVLPKLMGLDAVSLQSKMVEIGEDIKGFPNWNRIVTGKVIDGKFYMTFKTSSAISSYVQSDGFIHIKPNEQIVPKGSLRKFTYFLS